MEETLGKRIVANRKRMKLTQDQLAEKLGITAQAVSKWENDQSCPDITMLPKLAAIFGITTDQLLGIEPEEKVHEGEVIKASDDEQEPEGLHIQNGNWELKWDGGRKSGVGFALLVLLVGGLLLAGTILEWEVSFWGLLWPSAVLIFGLFGLFPKFSFFRLGCALFGGYFLANELDVLPTHIGGDLIFPVVLVLLGLSLLAEAFRRPKKPHFHVHHNGREGRKFSSECEINGECFSCSTAFGGDSREIAMPRLSGGSIDCTFGELTVDMSGCEEVAPGCTLAVSCAFGSVAILLPRRFRAETADETSFGSVSISGQPDPDALPLRMNCDVSFGSVEVRYI